MGPNGRREPQKPCVEKWDCRLCDYTYDAAAGDPTQDVEAGTSFEDLSEDWLCPVCGVGKEQFEREA